MSPDIPVTPVMRDGLMPALNRVKANLPQLLRDWTDAPEGMTATVIRRWAEGKTQTANPDWWQALMTHLAALPDRQLASIVSKPPPHAKAGRAAYRPVPPDQLNALRQYHHRTGITGEKLLKDAPDKPAGLDGSMIAAWISGATRSALSEHVAYVLARYAALASDQRS